MTIQQRGKGLRAENRNLYENIHQWLNKNFKKMGLCQRCGTKGVTEFALKKDETYRKERDAFLELCKSCHRKMDYTEKSRQSLIARNTGKPSPRRQKVAMVGIDGWQKFQSLKEASIVTGISRTAISNCLTGRAKTAGGYKWIYEN